MQPWINHHPLIFACVMLAGIALFRWLLLNLISAASGWKALARRFTAQQPFPGQQWKWQSARMRFGMGYNNSLRVGADQMGLSIRPVWGIRTAHPALFVPWQEISVGQAKGSMMGHFVRLSLGRTEQVPFTIRLSLATSLQGAAGTNWPAPPALVK